MVSVTAPIPARCRRASTPQPLHDRVLRGVGNGAQGTVQYDIGMHLREADGRLSWWCAGERVRRGPAHIRAAVGELDTFVRPRRPNRKKRRR
jgi:hypothetical protein